MNKNNTNCDNLKYIINKMEEKRFKNQDNLYLEYLKEDNERLYKENIELIKEKLELQKQIANLKTKISIANKKRTYNKKDEKTKKFEKEYKQFRQEILKRDNYTCQECGSINRLQVHHIKSRKEYPELIMEANNCITLCISCHSKTNNFFTS